MFVYFIIRLILKRNGFFDYKTSKKVATQDAVSRCGMLWNKYTVFFLIIQFFAKYIAYWVHIG